ncbi:hypothetical protein [Brevundimonas sp.]|uniref:hypothetical protein n=1 Tax=Brevundimonas sp. TaxID=1871086 RepID=UPI002FCA263B
MTLFDADESEPDYEVRDRFWRRKAVIDARRREELERAHRAEAEEGRREAGREGAA